MSHILKCHDIVKSDFVRGENCYLYDTKGKRYVDFESGIWCAALGHSHPRINQVIREQSEKLIHLGVRYPSILAEDTAKDILDIVGMDDGKGVFLSSGSEAVEFSVQTAKRTGKKQLLLTFPNSYLAAYGSAGKKNLNEWFLFDWNVHALPDPNESLKGIPFESVGAFVFEPGGSGTGFVRFPSGHVVQNIAQRVKQVGGLIVANEVTAGMGRTGKWFGFQHYDIEPDIVALGKGLGNGYPVSAVVMKRNIAEELENSGFHYAQSHQNDPLGCRIAREVIAILKEEHWIERGNKLGAYFLEGLKRFEEKYDVVKEARGRGMLLGLELYPNRRLTVQAIYETLLEHGFLVGYYSAGNVLRFDPAFTIEEDAITSLLDNLDSILKKG